MVQNSSKHWTQKEDNRLRELVISNAATFDIAAELGRNVSAVRARAVSATNARALAPDLDRRGHSPPEASGRGKCQRRFNRKITGALSRLCYTQSPLVESFSGPAAEGEGEIGTALGVWKNRHVARHWTIQTLAPVSSPSYLCGCLVGHTVLVGSFLRHRSTCRIGPL
jgi:hypothetical protein